MVGDKQALAIVAGRGALPRLLAEQSAHIGPKPIIVRFAGTDLDWVADFPVIEASFEGFGAMFSALHAAGCSKVVFAGGMDRPNPDPARFDAETRAIAPFLFSRIGKGDDAVLRAVALVFEAAGFQVIAAHEVLKGLVASDGVLGHHAPNAADLADIDRAAEISAALGALDVGQGAIVAQGLCLGLETLQGTDRMLTFVANSADMLRPDPSGAKGVLFKGPKPGQDLRMDMPAIGPLTVTLAAKAGLSGVAMRAGGVLILQRTRTIALADDLGLFLYGLSQAKT